MRAQRGACGHLTVAGLAALLVAQHGHGKPALIRSKILGSAGDLGEPGTEPHYG